MKNLLIAVVISLLIGCGGGGSSSGGGAPGPTLFAGTYSGDFIVSVSDGVVSDSASFTATLLVAENGQVDLNVNGVDDATCINNGPSQIFINGNSIPLNASGSCFLPGIGVCDINLTGAITINGGSAIGTSTGTISCPFGVLSVRYDFGFTLN